MIKKAGASIEKHSPLTHPFYKNFLLYTKFFNLVFFYANNIKTDDFDCWFKIKIFNFCLLILNKNLEIGVNLELVIPRFLVIYCFIRNPFMKY